jgi:hypothetical protein
MKAGIKVFSISAKAASSRSCFCPSVMPSIVPILSIYKEKSMVMYERRDCNTPE